jgi:hypothetical protein
MIHIRTDTAKLLKNEFQIEPEVTKSLFDSGFLQDQHCRDRLIRDEYNRKSEPREKQRLRNKLAEKYCISVSLVEKITLKNTQ